MASKLEVQAIWDFHIADMGGVLPLLEGWGTQAEKQTPQLRGSDRDEIVRPVVGSTTAVRPIRQIQTLLQVEEPQGSGPGDFQAACGRRRRERSCRWSIGGARVGEPPQEEHAPGLGVTNQKHERMIS